MIRVNITYPNEPGARFDFDYYAKKHIPMVQTLLSAFGLGAITIDRGVSGVMPGSGFPYICVATIEFSSVEQMQSGLMAHAMEIMGDIPNYTSVQPSMQISEIIL
jgi:uncharacterized protein (TIGR02118 family)